MVDIPMNVQRRLLTIETLDMRSSRSAVHPEFLSDSNRWTRINAFDKQRHVTDV